MRSDTLPAEPRSALRETPLPDRSLDKLRWATAWRCFLDEDYETALAGFRACLDGMKLQVPSRLILVPDGDNPTVKDGVVLVARCLFQLDRRAEFEVFRASAGRWGLVPEVMPELDVVQLAFDCKQGQYSRVVTEATVFVDKHRRHLPPVIADFLYLRGLAGSHLGVPEQARDDAEAAHAMFRVLGRELDQARTANLLGIVAFRASRFDEAEKWWRCAHEMHAALGMIKNMGGNRLNLGIACYKRGRFHRAQVELKAAVRLLEQVGARVSLCRAGLALGHVLRLEGDVSQAREQLSKAFRLAGELELPREEALALEYLGDVQRDEGRHDQARRFYSRALTVGHSLAPDGDIVMEVLHRQGECLGRMGRAAEAVAPLKRALVLARRMGDRFEEGGICRTLAVNLLALADHDSAAARIDESVAVLRDVGAEYELALSLLVAAELGLARLQSGISADPQGALDQAWSDALAALHLQLRVESEAGIRRAREVVSRVAGHRHEIGRIAAAPIPKNNGGRRPSVGPQSIIYESPIMRDLIQMTDAFANSNEPVLITGETGTGKELFAGRLHQGSARRRQELVTVNVSAIPESIFGREFFGHVRGAYTGADSDGQGFAARAHGGTLFLDEIGDLPMELQPRLLRLLQDGTYQAIGDPRERRSDIRLIAATNADLNSLVAAGRFRADLYYRLKILELRLPAVRERRDDVLPLLRHFLRMAAGRPVELSDYFGHASLEAAQRYGWPGNVREIATVARQAHLQLASRGVVQVRVEAPDGESAVFAGPGSETSSWPASFGPAAPLAGRSLILEALASAGGNRARAARRLGVSRSTLYRKMEKLGIETPTVGS